MTFSRKKSLLALGFTLALVASQHGLAGEVLQFKAGSFNPAKVSSNLGFFLAESEDFNTHYQVVQFQQPIKERLKQELRNQGLKIISYIPDDALLVKVVHVDQKVIVKSNVLRATTPYYPGFRISPAFEPRSVFTQAVNEVVAIRLADELESAMVVNTLEGMGVHVIEASGRQLQAHIKLGQLLEVARIEGVEWVQPRPEFDVQFKPLLGEGVQPETMAGDYTDLTGYESGTHIMNFASAWGRGFTGAGQTVSHADTGLDSGKLSTLFVDFSNVTGGHVFGLFSDSWKDPMGHGTHVGGSIAGKGEQSGGAFKGGAYGAELIPHGMWSKMLKNLSVPSNLGDLFSAAKGDGAYVHSNSWGSPRNLGAYDGFAIQVDEYMWANPDVLVIFAAGNSGVDDNRDGRIDPGSVSSPGTAKNTLTVGASENYLLEGGLQRTLGELLDGKPWGTEPLKSDKISNNENGVAAFSSRGPTSDGRLKPEVVAPGTNIVSNCSHEDGSSPLWGHYNTDYCYSGGTSMSTPLVAGAATVVRQYLVEKHSVSHPSAALVKAVLMHTATDMYPGQYGAVGKSRGQELLVPGPNNNQGFGRVNVAAATALAGNQFVDHAGVAAGQSVVAASGTAQGSTVRVTMVYTDAPGSPSASRTLVNNLSLEVFSAGKLVAQTDSNVNNHEFVELSDLTAGAELEIKVKGVNVPQSRAGKLPFALVVSGI